MIHIIEHFTEDYSHYIIHKFVLYDDEKKVVLRRQTQEYYNDCGKFDYEDWRW